MASGPAPPPIAISPSPHRPADAAPDGPPRPPSIFLEPTSDDPDSDDDGNPFRFEDHSHSPSFPPNPHAAALLRRSPSPVLGIPPPSPSPPTPSRPSSAQSAGLLSADAHAYGRSANPGSSFLQPPPRSGTPSAMDTPSGLPAAGDAGPFNFQTQYISTSPVKSNMGLRRGHRYKHSSVSAQHQIFQEPPPRPPPVLPASLPVPTLREAWASMQRDQRARLYWCLCHAAVAVFVFLCAAEGGDSLALTALSHLVFFDVGSAAVCVAVDVLGNFEVWRRSTIRHPFGLRRAEVLAGFAMSIFLVFGGFDLLSHDLKDCLEAATAPNPLDQAAGVVDAAAAAAAAAAVPHMDIGSHSGHHHHHTRYIHPGSVDVAALAAFASTLISAYGLGNHARIRRALLLLRGVGPFSTAGLSSPPPPQQPGLLALSLAVLLANPFHFLTMAVSLVLLVLPLLFVAVQTWLDRLLCATIAVSMLLLGARLAVAQGLMLLMSYSGRASGQKTEAAAAATAADKTSDSVAAVLDEIAAEPQVARVEDAQFWQVHYGLCMANLRVRVAAGCGDDATLRQLRARIARVVQNRLGEGYGRGNSLRWEVTVQTSVEG